MCMTTLHRFLMDKVKQNWFKNGFRFLGNKDKDNGNGIVELLVT